MLINVHQKKIAEILRERGFDNNFAVMTMLALGEGRKQLEMLNWLKENPEVRGDELAAKAIEIIDDEGRDFVRIKHSILDYENEIAYLEAALEKSRNKEEKEIKRKRIEYCRRELDDLRYILANDVIM